MQTEKTKKPAKAKRKLTAAEKRQITPIIRKAKGDGKPHTAQQSIPYLAMYPDGICRASDKIYSKSMEFSDISYQLAGNDAKTATFENLCDFYNYFDSSIAAQFSFINLFGNPEEYHKIIDIPPQNDDFDDVRAEYAGILHDNSEKGANGIIKRKFLSFSIENDNPKSAKTRLERIETDLHGHFRVIGSQTTTLSGRERLKTMFDIFHPDGKEKFAFDWDWLPASGLSTKDFIAPTSFTFGDSRTFRMGNKIGAASFLQILAPELNDRLLADFLKMETSVIVTMHIRSIDQTEAIKMVKRKITELDSMKITEQKRAVQGGWDMDILPSDLATFGGEAKNLLHDLQSRNERMFLMTFTVINLADTKEQLENDVFAAAGIAQKHNCALYRLDNQQEKALMSALPLGVNYVPIQRDLTTSSTAIFVPFTTGELLQSGEALYYGRNALSGNMIMADRKQLKNPKGLYCKGRSKEWKIQASVLFAAQTDGQPRKEHGNRNILPQHMTYSNAGKVSQKNFENSSDLPPVFLLLVRECFSPKCINERSAASIFYTTHPQNSIFERSQSNADNYKQCG